MADHDALSFLNRDEQGRFASKETVTPAPVETPPPEIAPTPEPVQAAVSAPAAPPVSPSEPPPAVVPAPVRQPEPTVPPGYVPIAAQLDERDKRQALERRLEEANRKLEEATKKTAEPIDPIADPDGFRGHFEQELRRVRFDTLAQFSKTLAVKDYGAESITAAEQWLGEECKRNPGFWQSVESNPHPYDFVVKQHKRAKQMETLGDRDLDAWFEEQAKARGYALQPTSPAPPGASPAPATPTPLPRPSLASAPAASSTTPKGPTGPGIAFGGVFAN